MTHHPGEHHRVEYAVLSEDGQVYEVEGRTLEEAQAEARLLQKPDEDGHAEPLASVIERRICEWVGAPGIPRTREIQRADLDCLAKNGELGVALVDALLDVDRLRRAATEAIRLIEEAPAAHENLTNAQVLLEHASAKAGAR